MSDDKPGLTPWQKEALEHHDQTSEEMRATVVAAGEWCAPSTIPLPVSRESLLWGGHVEPTEDERRAAAEGLYEQYLADKAAWEETERFLARFEAWKPAGIEKEILELHGMDRGFCVHCGSVGDEFDEPTWPCATVRLILHNNYIDVPQRLVYIEPQSLWQDENNPRWPFPAGPVDPFLTIPLLRINRGGVRFDGETINIPTDG